MSIQSHIFSLLAVALFAANGSGSPLENITNSVQLNLKTNVPLIPIVADIEKDLSTNTTASTKRLTETLEALKSSDLYYACGLVRITEEERMKGPPKYDTFLKIQQELMRRGGGLVQQAFAQILVTNNLAPDEKQLMRSYLRQEKGADVPFCLPADDRTQTREYFLRFDPKKSKVVTVRKGDVLVQIAGSEYPQLSQWSAIEIIAFINDLKNPEVLHPNQRLEIYKYEIVKDEQAEWTKTKRKTIE